jgi:hypothetical protein
MELNACHQQITLVWAGSDVPSLTIKLKAMRMTGPKGCVSVKNYTYSLRSRFMRKIVAGVLLTLTLFGAAGCSSYPSWVPEWAQVGSSGS